RQQPHPPEGAACDGRGGSERSGVAGGAGVISRRLRGGARLFTIGSLFGHQADQSAAGIDKSLELDGAEVALVPGVQGGVKSGAVASPRQNVFLGVKPEIAEK